MNQGKLEVVKQAMARVNIIILGSSELRWTGMGEFNSDDHYIYYCGQESLRRNGVAIMVKKRVWNAVLGCNLKNDSMISVRFQGKPFNIMVIQVYAPTSKKQYQVKIDLSQKPDNAGDVSLILGSVKSPKEANGSSLHYSCLEKLMDRGAWQATVPGVAKSWTQLSD